MFNEIEYNEITCMYRHYRLIYLGYILWRRLEHTDRNVELPTVSSQNHTTQERLLHGAPTKLIKYHFPPCKLLSLIHTAGACFRDPNQKRVSDVIIILDQKQDGIAAQKRERNQKIVFSLWRVQSSTFLKIYGVIQFFAK